MTLVIQQSEFIQSSNSDLLQRVFLGDKILILIILHQMSR
jgi:hypothetical protein